MKVLLINNCHWRRGGSETVYFGIGELLLKAGHDIVFFSLEDKRNINTGEIEYFVKQGNVIKKTIAYFSNTEAAKTMDLLIKKEKPDIAHIHLIWGGITASIVPVIHKYGIPVVHTVHDYRMVCPAYTLKNGHGMLCQKCKNGHYKHCISNKCCNNSFPKSVMMSAEMLYRSIFFHPSLLFDSLIYVSYFGREIHEQMDVRFKTAKANVLHNFVFWDKDRFRLKGSLTYDSYYLYFGRLSYEKGIMTLIKAFEFFPAFKLVIMGDGPLKDELRQYVNKRGIINIEFLDARSGDSLYEIVSKAKFIVAPSEWYEMLGMTVLEGYSMGVPVLASNIGGLAEIIKDGQTGFLFRAGDCESLKNGIRKCESLSVKEYSMFKEAAYNFGQVFSEKNYLRKLLDIYQSVIEERG